MKKYRCVRLKEVRLEKGLTQKELSKLMKISVYKLRQLEKCLISPTFEHTLALENILDVRINYILGTEDIKEVVYYNNDIPEPDFWTIRFH